MSDRRIEWDVAEVIDYDYTYRYIPGDQTNPTTDKLFAFIIGSVNLIVAGFYSLYESLKRDKHGSKSKRKHSK